MPFELPLATVESLAIFLLVFCRMTGVLLSAPLLSGSTLPPQLRIWLGFGCALLCFPIVRGFAPAGAATRLFSDVWLMTYAVLCELATGWVLGLVASIVLWGAQLAGHLVGQEIGLTLGDVFDPISETTGSPTTGLFYTVMLLVFLLLDGHKLLFLAVVKSYAAAPPGALLSLNPDSALYVTRDLGGEIWRLGVQIALPAIIGLGLVTVALAILARTAPEMNIFVMGFTLRVGVGLLGLALIVPFVVEAFAGTVGLSQVFLDKLLAAWGTP
ncbi:MAG: flagellar biosynthetic protein FliR [Planctomycetota bacterium]